MSLLAELEWRGLVHQKTATDLDAVFAQGPLTLYNGYDPTAASLHVGHLLPLTLMKHFARAGHKVIALVGGGTGQIGDPSGKASERSLLDVGAARDNAEGLMRQIAGFLSVPDNPPLYANNEDWLGSMGLLAFLRETGKHFSVNAMIHKDSVKSRLERDGEGISFTEFSYSLLQARDFLELYRRHGCALQTGGSDQWGNIVAGVELIRRVEGARVFGLTVPLLVDSDGNKFGKSEKGAVFLDPDLTSPYHFYQFWVNTADEDVVRYLKLFTFLSREQIEALGGEVGSGARTAQKKLAWLMTEAVHGARQADKAARAADVLFGGDVRDLPLAMLEEIFADAPTFELAAGRLAGQGLSVIELLVEIGACSSRGDARRQIQQGAIKLNGVTVPVSTQLEPYLGQADFLEGKILVVGRGKRNNSLVRLVF